MHSERPDMEPTVVWRRPAKRGPATPLVVLLHGRGADERDLIDLAADLPRTYAYASLRGPLELPEGGFRWFEDRGVGRPIANGRAYILDGQRKQVPIGMPGYVAGMNPYPYDPSKAQPLLRTKARRLRHVMRRPRANA